MDVKKSGWIVILLILSLTAYGQNYDARMWTGLSIRYSPSKNWKITLEEEARFHNNISMLDKLNTELTINYQINKIFDGGILYRLISNKNPGGGFDFNHRFAAYLGAQKNYGRWTCTFSTAFQKTYAEFRHTDEWYKPESYVRPLAEISRQLKNKKTEPYTNIEFWYRVSGGGLAFVDQYRFTLGIKHKLNKSNRLNLFYLFQKEIQVKDPLVAHILGVGYRFFIR